MFWILVGVGVVVIASLLSGGSDGLDYRAREVRAAMQRRDAAVSAQMRRIRRARRRHELCESLRWARTTPEVVRA